MKKPALQLTEAFAEFAADERGATAIEYALMAGGIGATVAATVYALGGSVSSLLFDRVVGEMGAGE